MSKNPIITTVYCYNKQTEHPTTSLCDIKSAGSDTNYL